MSRFAPDPAKLEQDGAMTEYRKFAAKDPEGLDPAEWIEALHREHWALLELLKQSEGERVARLMAGLKLVLREAAQVETAMGLATSALSDVLGDTAVVERLRDARRELRRGVVLSIEAMLQESQHEV